jgi:hypothetical protein
MALIAPPGPPLRVALADDDGMNRLRFRLYLLTWTMATVLITAWLCFQRSWVPAILALVVAKHIFVAILVSRLGVDAKAGDPVRGPGN